MFVGVRAAHIATVPASARFDTQPTPAVAQTSTVRSSCNPVIRMAASYRLAGPAGQGGETGNARHLHVVTSPSRAQTPRRFCHVC